ncbi:MAG: hypothetical protein RI973_1128 [Bacteroidota bacterium]|jgi:hypothetical protein
MIKTMYILWFQGFENAPQVPRGCLATWKYHNPDWEIVVLDETNIKDYVDVDAYVDLSKLNISRTCLSEIIRTILLKKYGGLWVDSTVFCNVPLSNWLEQYIETGFFAFEKPGPDRLLSSWFLYAEKDSYIMDVMYEEVRKFWMRNTTNKDYFWFHYLFGDIYAEDPKFKSLWDATPKIAARGPHRFNRSCASEMTQEEKDILEAKVDFVYKLTYKYEGTLAEGTAFHYLFKLKNMLIGNRHYPVSNIFPELRFIHIGKCGGTYILELFRKNNIYLEYSHLKKVEHDPNAKYFIWLRHPLTRFISAFYFSYDLINCDISHLDVNDISLDNTMAPARIRNRLQGKPCFSEELDELFNFFGSPNCLLESLTSKDPVMRDKAITLISSTESTHFHHSIGWNLDNGDFVEKNVNNIFFVGSLENMREDVNKLMNLLNFKLDLPDKKVRENINPHDKSLSKTALENFYNFYKDTDYKAIKALYDHHLISEELYRYYTSFDIGFSPSAKEVPQEPRGWIKVPGFLSRLFSRRS